MSSSYERGKIAEETAKQWLQIEFNSDFCRRNLQVGSKSNGKPAMHSFDFASEDNQIVAEVKSHQRTKSGNIPSAKISDTYQACFMLEKVRAKKKLLILTDPKFYEVFKRYSEGKISKEIEIVLLHGDANLKRADLKAVTKQSKQKGPKKTDFNAFWSRLTSWLSDRRRITNWTANSGEIGEDFEVEYAGGNYIIVYPKSALCEQRVPKKDFEAIYEKWDEYAAGLIPRHYFVKGSISKSRFTKYTISTLHQYLSREEFKKK